MKDFGVVLPEGWTVDVRVRKSGTTQGGKDTYYISPQGKRYRSMRKVCRNFKSETQISPEVEANLDYVRSLQRYANPLAAPIYQESLGPTPTVKVYPKEWQSKGNQDKNLAFEFDPNVIIPSYTPSDLLFLQSVLVLLFYLYLFHIVFLCVIFFFSLLFLFYKTTPLLLILFLIILNFGTCICSCLFFSFLYSCY